MNNTKNIAEESCVVLEANRLKNFPIMMFAIVMGFSGFTIMFQKAHEVFALPSAIGLILAYIDMGIFICISLVYIIKMVRYFDSVRQEFTHPVRINFFAASSISLLLLSIIFHAISQPFSQVLWYVGTIMQTFFTFYTMSFWINKNLELNHSSPAWFIPVVGNIIVPVAGSSFADTNILMYYFAVGIFFWVILSSILVNRIIFHHQMAGKFIPTMFIFIAPPAIGLLAYVKMYGSFDIFASFLYNLALFFTFLLFFMFKNFTKLQFFISWWAFTFPLAAISLASMLAYSKTDIAIYAYFSYFFIFVTTVVISIVTFRTVEHMLKKEICVLE